MNGNTELLNYIYQNSEMGQDTLKQLMVMVEDDAFKKTLEYQYNEYKKIFDISDSNLKEVHREGKGINVLTKVSTYIMINIRTLTNKTPSHISEMLIRGSTMGIIDITKKLKEYKDADKEILDLGNKLLQFEQRSVKELKKFL
ncbi:hypothetical protein [Clostridium magnum]|uniref:DUF2383 domain-containing protein n=1 Tax=Clostridium magnum DSM 2767 TaxID=1121326 RepID=A0A161X541_9CLOT|nr:hypothetical protein [Clostridium magnum]KZL89076.1 hypothetical protein CLMAG_55610 [Clostridium magnum DSM 2767]SHI29744.1 hypothetical protein SAMN02745944_04071 [Clostridium magnum DSM 2767]